MLGFRFNAHANSSACCAMLSPHDFTKSRAAFSTSIASSRSNFPRYFVANAATFIASSAMSTAIRDDWALAEIEQVLSTASQQLQARFGLSERQAEAILNMRLAKLTGLERDPFSLDRECDWVIKHKLIEAYRERHGLALADPKGKFKADELAAKNELRLNWLAASKGRIQVKVRMDNPL